MHIRTLPILDCRSVCQRDYDTDASSEGSMDWNDLFDEFNTLSRMQESPIPGCWYVTQKPSSQLDNRVVACMSEMLKQGALTAYSNVQVDAKAPVAETAPQPPQLGLGLQQIFEIAPSHLTCYAWKGDIASDWLVRDMAEPDLDDPLALASWLRHFADGELRQVLLTPVEEIDPAKSDAAQITLLEAIVRKRYESVLDTIQALLPHGNQLEWVPAAVRGNILSELSKKAKHEPAAKAILLCLHQWDPDHFGIVPAGASKHGASTLHPKLLKLIREVKDLPKPYPR